MTRSLQHAIRTVQAALLGKRGDAWVVASETCALDIMQAEYIRDVMPGEVLFFDRRTEQTGLPVQRFLDKRVEKYAHCIFEYIYFSRPDSRIFEEKVDKVRRRLGKVLALQNPVKGVDEPAIIISVPDSSNTAPSAMCATVRRRASMPDLRSDLSEIIISGGPSFNRVRRNGK